MTLLRKELMRMTDAQISEELRRRAKPQCGSMGNIYHPDEAILREAASRLQAPAVAGVEVKPLEWSHYDNGTAWAVSTCGLAYQTAQDGWRHHNGTYNAADGIEAAKAAAQADYERRIRSSLRTGGSE